MINYLSEAEDSKASYEIEEDQAVAGLVAAHFGIFVVPNMPILNLMDLKVIHIGKPNWEE